MGSIRLSLRRMLLGQHILRRSQSSKTPPEAKTDEFGMPLKPTWSVKELLASYPPPVLEPYMLKKIHKLAALIPPPEGSPESEALRHDLSEMIRMVEAVKTIQLPDSIGDTIPDGRIWPEGHGMTLNDAPQPIPGSTPEPTGRTLLEKATNTRDGFYLVESQKTR